MRSSSAAEHCSEQAKQESWWVACIRGEGGGRCAAEANDLFGLVICPPLPNGLGTQKQENQFGELPPPLLCFPDTDTGLERHTRNARSCLKSVQESTRQELEGLFWKLQCNAIKSVEKPQKQLTMQADSQPQSKQMDQFDG